jgi:hypothetical protein
MFRRMILIYRLAKSEASKQGCPVLDIFERALNDYAAKSKRKNNPILPKEGGRIITLD